MNIQDIIAQAGGIQSIARELGTDEGTTQRGVQALLPAVLGGFRGQAEQGGGLGALGPLLGGLGGAGLLNSVLSPGPSDVGAGNNVLGSIFGSKDTSRAVAEHAAQQSGVEPSLLKKMLPLLGMLVAGYMAKQMMGGGGQPQMDATQQGGGAGAMQGMDVGSAIGGMLGGQPQGGMGGMGGGGFGGLGQMLGMGGGSNPLQDILGRLGR